MKCPECSAEMQPNPMQPIYHCKNCDINWFIMNVKDAIEVMENTPFLRDFMSKAHTTDNVAKLTDEMRKRST